MDTSPLNILAVITARSGSKGLPRKNVLPLAGKPLIAWSIEAALKLEQISRVIVSTDDEEIAEVSRNYGADIPFVRSSELATDEASGVDVVIDALKRAQEYYGEKYDWVLLLQPTSPLRSVEDIQSSINIAEIEGVDSVIGVKEVSEYPQWMKAIDDNGCISDYCPDLIKTTNRQEIDIPYIINGAIYLTKASLLLQSGHFYGGVTKAYIMPQERSIDIDNLMDFNMAEWFCKHKEKS